MSKRHFDCRYFFYYMVDSREFAKYIVATAQSINENCRVWNYGPVYPKIYRWYSKNMGKDVSCNDIKPESLSEINSTSAPDIVKQAVEKFSKWTSVRLSEWSHQPGSPWDIARINRGMYSKKHSKHMAILANMYEFWTHKTVIFSIAILIFRPLSKFALTLHEDSGIAMSYFGTAVASWFIIRRRKKYLLPSHCHLFIHKVF